MDYESTVLSGEELATLSSYLLDNAVENELYAGEYSQGKRVSSPLPADITRLIDKVIGEHNLLLNGYHPILLRMYGWVIDDEPFTLIEVCVKDSVNYHVITLPSCDEVYA